ncbi:cell growth-regulating nucleolar protein-like [Liolophura sinensis]|uniref:cell growth-regulating nucleolar protein-like n=1 Tax=Liolophura sinensis TaxID=3198878 RepID=UPI003158A7C3
MVVFNCNACGESLKKNQVEKHYLTICRRCEVLSCVDCGKDFWGDGYKEHTKCISEEEKYSGKNYKPKANANKGEAKQEAWLEKVQSAIDQANTEPRVKAVLETLKDYPNIPRKKAKFENFLGNSLRVWDRSLSSKVWNLLMENIDQKDNTAPSQTNYTADSGLCTDSSSRRNKDSNSSNKDVQKQPEKENNESENVDTNVPNSGKNKKERKKKRKHKEKEDINDEEASDEKKDDRISERLGDKIKNGKRKADKVDHSDAVEGEGSPSCKRSKTKIHFDWSEVICDILRSRSDQEISVKKLKKKVIAEYLSQGGFVKSEEKLWAKFQKKVTKNPNLKVLKDRVKLVHVQ